MVLILPLANTDSVLWCARGNWYHKNTIH